MKAKLARGVRRACQEGAAIIRLIGYKAQYPGLVVEGRVRIGRGCSVYVAPNSTLLLRDCFVSDRVTLTTSSGARLELDADFVGPGCVIVARESITIGRGTKIAEYVTIRDGNHDRSVPLREKRFVTSPVVVGDDVWLGAHCVVVPGVTIAKGATVGAGGVVTRDVGIGQVVVGVPARPISR